MHKSYMGQVYAVAYICVILHSAYVCIQSSVVHVAMIAEC